MKSAKKSYSRIEEKIKRQIRELGLRKIVATVSGGADSVALLSALAACRELEVTALHCNFHLRGEESMRDQRSVEELCRRLGVELLIKDFDTEGYIAANPGISTEMACRELRYEWFRETASTLGADRIATGHNADDNIETLLLNLFRGSGVTGLKGMLPDTGEIWHPLLEIHRSEILEYLENKGIGYVTDSTNLSSDYRRNFLRNDVLPMLRTRWAGLDKALDRSMRLLRDDNAIVTEAIAKALDEAKEGLSTDTVMEFPAPELLVRRFIEPAGPFTTTAAEVIDAMKAAKPHARRWQLRNGIIELRNKKLRIIKE